MPSYKLTYLNSRGRAEKIRLLFAAGGVEYEDHRIKDWEEFKKLQAAGAYPFGQVPVLEVDGKMLCQSMSMFRYVARQTGYSPEDSFEIAKADIIVDELSELLEKALKAYRAQEVRNSLFKEFLEKELSAGLVPLEKLLKDSGGKHFADNKTTYADVLLFSTLEVLNFEERKKGTPDVLDQFPLLKDMYERVENIPGIKEWLEKRPDTRF